MVDIPAPATPAKVGYEVPSSPNQLLPPPPSPPPSPPPGPALVGEGDEVVYDFIPGDQ